MKIPLTITLLLAWGVDYDFYRGMRYLSPRHYTRWLEYRPVMGVPQDETALQGARCPAAMAGQAGGLS